METIESFVAGLCGISIEELFSHSKRRKVADARKLCFKAIKELTDAKEREIGRYFNQHRTTPYYAIREYDDLFHTDKEFRKKAETLELMCNCNALILPFPLKAVETDDTEDTIEYHMEEETLIEIQ